MEPQLGSDSLYLCEITRSFVEFANLPLELLVELVPVAPLLDGRGLVEQALALAAGLNLKKDNN